jgi:hypothetical protein
MEHDQENVHGLRYYWEYLKRFGKESSDAWRRDFLYAFLLALVTVLLAWGDRSLLEGAILGVKAIVLLFAVIALRHLAHTSFLLFRERAHPASGGIRQTHWRYAVWGVVILLGMTTAITYAASHSWLRKPTVVLQVLGPTVPIFSTAPPPVNPSAQGKSPKPPARTNVPLNYTAPGSAPSRTSPEVAQSPPQPTTFLERVVQENRGLTPDDRNRLSTELYECDQFIKQSQEIGYKLTVELAKLSNDRQSGALAKNVEEHINLLSELDAPAWDRYHGLQRFQEKWQYFRDQTEYVLGDNPFNAGVGMLVNAAEGMAISLTRWSKISNRDQKEILIIEAQQQTEFERDMRQFFDWSNGAQQRIKQMRQSLDPNGVVSPIPQNKVAPSPAMLL